MLKRKTCIAVPWSPLYVQSDISLTHLDFTYENILLLLQVFINFAKYQTDCALASNQSDMNIETPSKLDQIKSRWRSFRQSISSRRRRTRFTQLMSMSGGQMSSSGSIGADEDEVSLDGLEGMDNEMTNVGFSNEMVSQIRMFCHTLLFEHSYSHR